MKYIVKMYIKDGLHSDFGLNFSIGFKYKPKNKLFYNYPIYLFKYSTDYFIYNKKAETRDEAKELFYKKLEEFINNFSSASEMQIIELIKDEIMKKENIKIKEAKEENAEKEMLETLYKKINKLKKFEIEI